MRNHKTKVLLMYLKTGGGHLAPARALAEYFEKALELSVEPVLHDGLVGAPAIVRFILEDGYRLLQARARWGYELLYAVNKIPFLARANSWFVGVVLASSLRESMRREQPDKIIILHFLLVQPIVDVLRELAMNVPVLIVVTDPFTAHPLWFLNKRLTFVVQSERLRQYCIAKGIAEEQLKVFPSILGARFSQALPSAQVSILKEQLRFAPERPVIFLLGGGDGLPRGEKILQSIVDANLAVEIVMVCGRNKQLEKQARTIAANSKARVTVFGYSDEIFELINVADIVISKGGASTMMEVLLLGKMLLISDYLWEQEKGNVEFLTHNGIGIYENIVKKIPEMLKRFLADEDWRRSVRENLRRLDLKNGTGDICTFIASFESPTV